MGQAILCYALIFAYGSFVTCLCKQSYVNANKILRRNIISGKIFLLTDMKGKTFAAFECLSFRFTEKRRT